MTDSLIFFMVEIRPDITFAISIASRFTKNPCCHYTEAVKTILRYMKGLRKEGIMYESHNKLFVEGYSDFDWVKDKESQKSTSSFIFIFNGGFLSWCSKRQPTVALLSTKAKYIALTLVAKKATWLRLLLKELKLLQSNK